jgi:hypothetical protein
MTPIVSARKPSLDPAVVVPRDAPIRRTRNHGPVSLSNDQMAACRMGLTVPALKAYGHRLLFGVDHREQA